MAATAERSWDRVLALGLPPNEPRLVHRSVEPARAARTGPLPADLDPRLAAALARRGVTRLYEHQLAVYDAAARGAHVGVVTGTASGKSLAYGLPVLQRLLADRHARALYLAPTKALAQDQVRGLHALGLGRDLRAAIYDGDTDPAGRSLARREANLLLTNPDMLHVGICPQHERWGDVLANLSHVVVDEAHVYRGVFGSHVGSVLRRLRRACAIHGSAPQLLLASATIGNPGQAMTALTGVEVEVVDDDASARPERTIALWNPTLLDRSTGERASPLAEAAALVASLVAEDQRVICFARSRKAVELIHRFTREALTLRLPEARDKIAPYRAGYTAEQRRTLERRLADGDLRAIVATSALELGIDIGLLDVSIAVGFPGTVAGLRQQWGRAGRSGEGLAMLVASADALDQFFLRRPEALLGRPVERAILDVTSPEIRAAHLACAAYEAPVAPRDDAILGPDAHATAVALAEQDPGGPLRPMPAGVTWAGADYPAGAVALRSSSTRAVAVVEEETGALLGTVEAGRAGQTVHDGAVYLHLGESYRVRRLDLEAGLALVEPFSRDWYTQTRVDTATDVEHDAERRDTHGVVLHRGDVAVTEIVLAYQRRRLPGHEPIDTIPLDLPPERFATQALWFTVPGHLLSGLGDPLGTLHAAEHALISVLPLHAMCDRWDIGGLSTGFHAGTGMPTIFIYDGHPGGVGITRHGYASFAALVADALAVIRDCPCEDGCPSCVQSPKCGNLNEPLSKRGARTLLQRMTRWAAA